MTSIGDHFDNMSENVQNARTQAEKHRIARERQLARLRRSDTYQKRKARPGRQINVLVTEKIMHRPFCRGGTIDCAEPTCEACDVIRPEVCFNDNED